MKIPSYGLPYLFCSRSPVTLGHLFGVISEQKVSFFGQPFKIWYGGKKLLFSG